MRENVEYVGIHMKPANHVITREAVNILLESFPNVTRKHQSLR
jgi:hypothetical protein